MPGKTKTNQVSSVQTNTIINGDCREVLADFPDDFFSACITDPPYNYEFIGRDWNEVEIQRRVDRVKDSRTLVKNIPYGSGRAGGVRNKRWYENNRKNIVDYQNWCRSWGEQVARTLRPGGYALVFNSTRTVAHVQVALEDAGLYARDILVYRRHAGIPKGLNFAKKLRSSGDSEWASWEGWHSCLRNEWEAICVVQKPLLDNYAKTISETGVGLMRAEPGNGSGFLGNVIEGIKRSPKKSSDVHCTVKPLELIRFLIELVIPKKSGHIVLDPFAGIGTTCLATKQLGHRYVGIDISDNYCVHAREQIEAMETDVSISQGENRESQPSLFPL